MGTLGRTSVDLSAREKPFLVEEVGLDSCHQATQHAQARAKQRRQRADPSYPVLIVAIIFQSPPEICCNGNTDEIEVDELLSCRLGSATIGMGYFQRIVLVRVPAGKPR